ncbi:hypothetical protein C1X16_27760, partial [Pseudomonas sp. FW305-3-2-15-C-R2A1]
GLEIREACVEGREAQCRRAKYVETGRLAGGVSGAAFFGRIGAGAARRACTMFLGIRMKGTGELACGIIGGSAGGYVAGDRVGSAGALLGGKIMDADGDLIFLPEGT